MEDRPRVSITPIIVMVVDFFWGWMISVFVRPWMIGLLRRSPLEASQLIDETIEPRLWISYAVVLVAQLCWVNLIIPRYQSPRLLRKIWWIGCLIITLCSLLVHQGLMLTAEPQLLIFAVQLADLVLLYWLTTRLLSPLPQRKVIPGWW